MDVGQGQAAELWQQAGAGTFRMEPEAARRCAEVFQRFAESLDEQVREADDTRQAEGFGGFQSSIELQNGFVAKGEKLKEALIGAQEAALRMAAAYLRSGQLFEEADDMNRQAMMVAGKGIPG